MRTLALACAALFVPALSGADYTGPKPPKPDVPYLLHADSLVETEATEAKEDKRKDETIYSISGASSPAKTPMAEPIFLFLSEKHQPEALELYQLEVKGGSRQVVISEKKKKSARPIRLSLTRVADRLYRIEVNEGMGLENGQYSLTPSGSNEVFCFEVY